MTITLPDSMKDVVDRRARESGFGTADEYVAWLVEGDAEPFVIPTPQQLGFADLKALEDHLLTSLNSGPPVLADEAFWEERRRELEEVIAQRNGGGR